jgi:glutamate-1-semialdehyde 2,1-aminomutase
MAILTARYEASFPNSRRLYEEARTLFPGGVTHDLRYLEPFPIYVDRALGGHKWDVDGHELIDYWSGHGAILLGHSNPAVVEAVRRQVGRGTHPGACHELEIEWGRWVQRLIPSAERMRFTASGTEATLMALRLARIVTGRPRFLKFAGHFHGWNDFVVPGSDPPYDGAPVPGVPRTVAAATVVVPPNDPGAVERALESDPDIGCVILEPTGGHWGQVPIRGDFLRALREITSRRGILLIFDEVITGFRVSPGGAQVHYGVTPDLTTLAKVLAGGLPGGCVAGRADVLATLEIRPGKPKMRHPGTFNANPLSAAAGIATLQQVATGEPCRRANETARLLRQRLNALFAERGWDWVAYGEFSAVRLVPGYIGPRPEGDDFIPYAGAIDKLDGPRDVRLVHAFRRGMLLHGVDLPGMAGMTSAAHTEEDVQRTVAAVAGTIEWLRAEGIVSPTHGLQPVGLPR